MHPLIERVLRSEADSIVEPGPRLPDLCPAARCTRCNYEFPPATVSAVCPRCLEEFSREPCFGSCWTCGIR